MISPWLFLTSSLSAILPVILGILYWRRLDKSIHFMILLAAVSIVVDAIGQIMIKKIGSNIGISNAFILIQYLLIGCYFSFLNYKDRGFKKSIRALFLISLPLVAVMSVRADFLTSLLNQVLTLTVGLIFVLCLIYFLYVVIHELERPLLIFSHFYIVTGLFIYTATTLAIYLTFNYLDSSEILDLWAVKLCGYVVFNIFLAIGCYLKAKSIP